MKIAYVVLKGMPLAGGIEKYTEEIGWRLAGKGHEIVVYSMRHYGAADGAYRGMQIRSVSTIRSRNLEKITASFVATAALCRRDDIDVIHFHAFGPAMFCLLPRLLGKKVIVQGHGLEWKNSRWGAAGRLFLKLTETPSVLFPHLVTVVSKAQQDYLRASYGIDSRYIPTGVNPPQVEKPDLIRQYGLQGNDYLLFVGRLIRGKGVHFLIDAYRRLKTPLKLVIAGDAAHEEAYKGELARLAEGDKNIIFTGFATGKLLRELYSNCYLFVLPSITEGLPTALLEAMSYGNCCLVSAIPGNLEALNGHGYSFLTQNTDDLQSQMENLTRNRDAAESVKTGARDYVLRNFLWDRIAAEFEALYKELTRVL